MLSKYFFFAEIDSVCKYMLLKVVDSYTIFICFYDVHKMDTNWSNIMKSLFLAMVLIIRIELIRYNTLSNLIKYSNFNFNNLF